jgi:hypothetical protein
MTQIVLAKLIETQEISKLGRVDIGEAHKWRDIKVPVSLMWLNNGEDYDVAEAQKYAKAEGYTVFLYEGEANPLERARQDISKNI